MIDFRVSYDQGTGVYIVIATGLTSTAYTTSTVTLTPDLIYNFKVESRNVKGYSAISAPIAIRAAKVPNSPTNLANNAVITAASIIGLTWTADYNGGSAILDYKVYFDQGTNTWTPFAFGIAQTSFTATGLTAGTTYKFKVQARNIVGYSDISAEISVIAAAYPSSPTDLLNVPAITDASNIGLRWTATYSGGSVIIDYRVIYDQATGVWV